MCWDLGLVAAQEINWQVPAVCTSKTVIEGLELPARTSLLVVADCRYPCDDSDPDPEVSPPTLPGTPTVFYSCSGYGCYRRAYFRWWLWCGTYRSYYFHIVFRRRSRLCCRGRVRLYRWHGGGRARRAYFTRVAIRPAPTPCNRCWLLVRSIYSCGRVWVRRVAFSTRVRTWGSAVRSIYRQTYVRRCCGFSSRAFAARRLAWTSFDLVLGLSSVRYYLSSPYRAFRCIAYISRPAFLCGWRWYRWRYFSYVPWWIRTTRYLLSENGDGECPTPTSFDNTFGEYEPRNRAGPTPMMSKRRLLQSGTSNIDDVLAFAEVVMQRVQMMYQVFGVMFGGDISWLEFKDSEWATRFRQATADSSPLGSALSQEEYNDLSRPYMENSTVSQESIIRWLNRYNRTAGYYDQGITTLNELPLNASNDFISLDSVQPPPGVNDTTNYTGIWDAIADYVDNALIPTIAEGYDDPLHALSVAVEKIKEVLDNPDEGVCATVRVRIEQTAVITRTGFTAVLDLENKQDAALSDIKVTLYIRKELDATGPLQNDLFFVQPPEFKGTLTSIDGGTLGPNAEGGVSWLIIPFREAAPAPGTFRYEVSGLLEYTLNGEAVTVDLWPDSIEVLPDPKLTIQYYWEREVFSDDPFTDEVEPAQAFSLAVLVKNTGNGTARSFKITSNQVGRLLSLLGVGECSDRSWPQPEIVDNEKGLDVGFQILGVQLDSKPVQQGLQVDFGDIPPQSQRVRSAADSATPFRPLTHVVPSS